MMVNRSDSSLSMHFFRYGLSTVAPAIFSVFLLSIFSREFTPAEFGRFSLVYSVAIVTSTLLSGWLNQSILRFEPEQPEKTLFNSLFSVTILALIASVLAVLCYPLLSPSLGEYAEFYLPGLAVLLSLSLFNVLRTIHESRLSSRFVSVVKIVKSVLQTIVALLLALVVLKSITGWLWGIALATVVVSLPLLIRANVRMAFSSGFDLELLRRMLLFGLPVVGLALTHNLLNFVDRLILEMLRGSASVGIYSSNYDLASQAAALVFGPFLQAIHPVIMNDWNNNDEHALSADVRRYTRYLSILGFPVFAFSIVLSEPLTDVLLAQKYAVGYRVIPLVVGGLLAWNLANVGHKLFEVKEQTETMLVGVAIALLTNLCLNIPLILLYGYLGAAVATFVSFLVYPVFVYAVSCCRSPWQIPWRALCFSLLGSVLIVFLYVVVTTVTQLRLYYLLVLVPLGVVLYVSFLYATNVFSQTEVETAKQFVTEFR